MSADKAKLKVAGFSYVTFVAVTIIAITCSLPLGIFGIVFGPFLASIGDETTATSLANAIFNTALCLTGLVANILLNKWTCRNVGLLGCTFCLLGCLGLFFAQNQFTFITFFGVFQGFGYGLLLPASLTALNNVFHNRNLAFMMSLSQALMVACCMLMPLGATQVIHNWGYRGAILCVTAITVLNVPASLTLTPFYNNATHDNNNAIYKSAQGNEKEMDVFQMTSAVEPQTNWQTLLISPKYLNISLGLSLSNTSDLSFITLIPLMLADAGFDDNQIATAMSLFFGSDMLARLLLSIASTVAIVKSRYYVLWGSMLSVVFRIAFAQCSYYKSKIAALATLGFLRCFIQTPLPLVISDEYPGNFANAFSLYMVVCGGINLVFGPLIGLVKSWTSSNQMVCHLLTTCYIVTVLSWLCEMAFTSHQKKQKKNSIIYAPVIIKRTSIINF